MPVNTYSHSKTSTSVETELAPSTDAIVGAAVFDLSGLPREYFTTNNKDINWVQTIFQALGLQSLLISSLQLEGFHHAIVHESNHQAVIVKQKTCYVALLVDRDKLKDISVQFINWVREVELNNLRAKIQTGTI
jgi:predicted regulator of Ras-like GTPase activity (Roadblock/LC7/MglB family)